MMREGGDDMGDVGGEGREASVSSGGGSMDVTRSCE